MKPAELHLKRCFALLGGLWAICWAMIYIQCETDRTRVSIDHSVPRAFVGMIGGYFVGWFLKWVCRVWPALSRVLSLFLPAVMAGSIAAPFGWLARDHHQDWSGAEAIIRAAAWGFGVVVVLSVAARAFRGYRLGVACVDRRNP